MRAGVSRQCTAHIIDMLMAKESNQLYGLHFTGFAMLYICEWFEDNSSGYSVNRECQTQTSGSNVVQIGSLWLRMMIVINLFPNVIITNYGHNIGFFGCRITV